MSSVSEVYQSLAESVSYYSHTDAILTRLHKSGWIEQIVELFSDIKQEEEKFTKRELKKLQRSAEHTDRFNIQEQLALNSKIFKSNFALIVTNIVNTIWENSESDAADQSQSKSSASKSSLPANPENFESVRGSEKFQDRSVRNFVAGSFRKEQPKEDSKLMDSKDSRSEMANPKNKQTASTAALKDPKKDLHHKTPATHARVDKKDSTASTAAAHKYTSPRTPAQVPQPQVLKVKASAINNRDNSSEGFLHKREQAGPQVKPKHTVISQQAESITTRRLASPRNKREQEIASTKPANRLVPDNKKIIRGSRSLERPATEPKETPDPKEDSESKKSSASKRLEEHYSEQEGVRLTTDPDATTAQELHANHHRSDQRSGANERRSRSPLTESDIKKAEEEFNRRLVISVKKKLLGNTGPLDVS